MPKLSNANSAALGEVWNAFSGNMTMVITPETVAPAPTAAAWTREVEIKIVNGNGKVCEWVTESYATTLSVGDTSTAGTATIASTTLNIVEGKATVVVSGDAADWLNTETDTLTVGNLTILGYTVTGGTSVETFTT